MKRFFINTLFCCTLSSLVAQTNITRIDGSPYPASAPADKLYLTSENMSYSEKIALQSLQGILAKTKPEILRDAHGHAAVVTKEGIPLDRTYYSNFPGLLTKFSSRLTGYILCTSKTSSVNVALSLSGILNAVAIPADIEQTAKNAGLTMLLDVRTRDEAWLLANYGTQFNKNIASYQNCKDDRGLFLGDYSVFAGAIQFWDDNANGTLSTSVFSRMSQGAAIFGYVPSEYDTVDQLSKKSLVLHPSDFSPNLSTLSNIPVVLPRQKDPVNKYKVVPNVHTVCFVMSDGDNMQWLSGASDDLNTWANPNRSRLNLGWTVSPAFAELAPIMYKKYLDNATNSVEGRNELVAGPSGRGYFFPSDCPTLARECVLLNKYMKKADLSIVNILDVDVAAHNPTEYLKQSNIDALFYYTYGANYTGMKGAITWYKDKPSIGGRYTLWGTLSSPESLAAVLNSASKNIASEAGYSLIPVHVWSRNVTDVMDCIKRLGPNVRVVAPDEFVWLVKKNLKNLPMGSGNGLKGDYYSGSNFDVLKYTMTNGKINFDWGNGSPNKNFLGTDLFSIRWTGQIQPLYTQEYTFYGTAHDGVKLTVNGTVLFDGLSAEGANVQSGKISLTAGQKYDITMEYVEKTGDAICDLEWESSSQVRQTVPRSQLYSRSMPSTGVVTAYADSNFGGFSGGLAIGDYTLSDLNFLGIYDKDIASLKVGLGYKAVLYENDNFGGQSIEITADSPDLGNWIDKVSSIKIIANGDTNLEGTYYLNNRSSKFNMDVTGGIGALDDGANIQQWTVATTLNQRFKLTHLGNGCYSIIAVHSNKSLDVIGYMTSNGANVQQWTNYGSNNQQFILVPTGDGYYKIVVKNSGKIIESATVLNGANVRQWADRNLPLGQWQLNEVPPLPNGNGDGLDGKYYNGMNFETFKIARVDTTINFDWGTKAPNSLIGVDNFSVRWTGKIQPRFTGNYTFYINSDNGRRLYINNQLVINKWISDYGIEYSGNITLNANQLYDIKLDYFEEVGGANCKLEWFSPEQPREVVPKTQLYSASNAIVENKSGETKVTFFPVPVTNKTLNVEITGLNEKDDSSLVIFDLLGKPVLHTQIKGSGAIDLKSISTGAYIVSISNKGISVNKRIVVQ